MASRWLCQTCGFTNYSTPACNSCGTSRPVAESGLLTAPSLELAPMTSRLVVTNELCLSRMPGNISERDLFTGIEAILKDFPTIDLAPALRGMRIDLSPGRDGFPSALAIVAFKEPEPAARVYETVRKAGNRFLGAKVRVEFSRRSILQLQKANAAQLEVAATAPTPVDDAAASQVDPAAVALPPPFSAPTWTTPSELRGILEDIDARWPQCSNELKQFYHDNVSRLNAPDCATEVPIPSAPPPPPACAPVAPAASAEAVAIKSSSFAERLAQAKKKQQSDQAASDTKPPQSAKQLLVGRVTSLGNWPRFGFVAAHDIQGSAVSRSALTASAFANHPRTDAAVVITVPQMAVEHALRRGPAGQRGTETSLGYGSFWPVE